MRAGVCALAIASFAFLAGCPLAMNDDFFVADAATPAVTDPMTPPAEPPPSEPPPSEPPKDNGKDAGCKGKGCHGGED